MYNAENWTQKANIKEQEPTDELLHAPFFSHYWNVIMKQAETLLSVETKIIKYALNIKQGWGLRRKSANFLPSLQVLRDTLFLTGC